MFNSVFQAPFRALFDTASRVVYFLRDEFTTPQAAPLISPRSCEPGPGTVIIVDTENHLSISNERLISTFGGTLANKYLRYDGVISNTAGLCSKLDMISGDIDNFRHGFGSSMITGGAEIGYAQEGYSRIIFNKVGRNVGTISFSASFPKKCFVISQLNHFMWVVTIGSVTKLIWVAYVDASITNLYPGISQANRSETWDNWIIGILGSPWNSEYGIATNQIASPISGTTTTSDNNALIEMSWIPAINETYEMMIRRTDDNNCWILRCSQSGSSIKLIEKTLGIETERSSAAQDFSVGTPYYILVQFDTSDIRSYISNAPKNVYSAATFNQSATGIKVLGFTNGTNLVCWPRYLATQAQTVLETFV